LPVNTIFLGGELSTSLSKADALVGWSTKSVAVDRKLKAHLREVVDLCNKLNLNTQKIKNRATEIFIRMTNAGLQKSLRFRVIQAASVLYAARLEGGNSNRTIKEIGRVSAIAHKEIVRCIKQMKQQLTNMVYLSSQETEHPVVSFSKNYAKYLNLPHEWVCAIATVAAMVQPNINEEVKPNICSVEKKWDGRSRASIAATVVYIVTQLPCCPTKVDMKMISQCSGVRNVTITACYRNKFQNQ